MLIDAGNSRSRGVMRSTRLITSAHRQAEPRPDKAEAREASSAHSGRRKAAGAFASKAAQNS